MASAPSERRRATGLLNVVLVLIWVGVTLRLMDAAGLDWDKATYALLVIGTPLACFVAYRMSSLRLLALLVLAGGLGYLKEVLAVKGDVWSYPPGGPAFYVAFLMGFGAVGTYALAHFLDEVFQIRHLLPLGERWTNALVVFCVFAVLLLLLAFEAHGDYGRAAAHYPAFLIFYLLLALIAWWSSLHARLGRIVVTMVAAMASCVVAEYLGSRDGLWSFKTHTTPLFLILGGWPLEFFVQYSLAAAASELLEARLRRQRLDLDVALRGALDKMVLWTAKREENVVSLVLFAALVPMGFEGVLFGHGDAPPAGPTRSWLSPCWPHWVFAFLPTALYLLALLAAHYMYCQRVYWLLGLGALLGLATEACRFWSYPSFAATYYFMVPVWGLLALATYGLAARLARLFWRGHEWQSLDDGGVFAALICAVAIAGGYAVSLLLEEKAWPPDVRGLIVIALFALAIIILAVRAGLSAAIPLTLLLVGYLLAHSYLREPLHVIPGLLFAALTAHLAYVGGTDLRARTVVALVLSSWVLCFVAQWVGARSGVFLHVHRYEFPWFFVLGLGPLVLGACYALSASGAGEVLNKEPLPAARRLREPAFQAPACKLPKKSVVALVTAKAGDGRSQAQRATECLRESIRLLAESLGYRGDHHFIRRFVGAGKTVFIKPNVVLPMYSPCVVLPELVRELARLCVRKARASKVRIGETSLSEFTARQALVSTGFQEYWEAVHSAVVEVTLLDESDYLPLPDGSPFLPYFTSLPRCLSKSESDRYISISKLKTHYITDVTLSIKNSLGLVLDEEKRIRHRGRCGVSDLAEKLVMITKARLPDLVIIDGFDGLEGEGPFVGDRVDTQFVIASNDPVAADAVAATMMGFDKDKIETCTQGAAHGIGHCDWANITIVTPDGKISPTSLPVRYFKRPYPPPGEEEWIGSLRLVAQDSHQEHAGPESTLYGMVSFVRPLAEVYMVEEWKKLKGLTIVYGALREPIECEVAMLFGERAIGSEHLVYAPRIWQIAGEIPNVFMEGFEQVVYAADADVAELLVTALRKSKGDYL